MKAKQFIGHHAREGLLRWNMRRKKPGAPKVLFFPSDIAQGSSLLRAYNISDALNARGWNTHVVPKQLGARQRNRLIHVFDPDLLLYQKSWHPLNAPEQAGGRPFVFDLDDADFLDPAHTDRIRRLATDARGVIAGSHYVADWCRPHNVQTEVIWTGTPLSQPDTPWPRHVQRAPIITWAQAQPLGYPAELAFVREFFARLAQTGSKFSIRLYGGDTEKDRIALEQALNLDIPIKILPRMDYAAFCTSLGEVSLGLSPVIHASDYSRGKSFGKILSYVDARVPVLTSDEVDHSLFFEDDCGLVSNDLEEWVACAQHLLAHPQQRDEIAQATFELAQNKLSLDAAADKVAGFLKKML